MEQKEERKENEKGGEGERMKMDESVQEGLDIITPKTI